MSKLKRTKAFRRIRLERIDGHLVLITDGPVVLDGLALSWLHRSLFEGYLYPAETDVMAFDLEAGKIKQLPPGTRTRREEELAMLKNVGINILEPERFSGSMSEIEADAIPVRRSSVPLLEKLELDSPELFTHSLPDDGSSLPDNEYLVGDCTEDRDPVPVG